MLSTWVGEPSAPCGWVLVGKIPQGAAPDVHVRELALAQIGGSPHPRAFSTVIRHGYSILTRRRLFVKSCSSSRPGPSASKILDTQAAWGMPRCSARAGPTWAVSRRCLLAADDEVTAADALNGLGKGIGGCQHIGPGEAPVGNQVAVIRPSSRASGRPAAPGRTHGQCRDGGAGFLPDPKAVCSA